MKIKPEFLISGPIDKDTVIQLYEALTDNKAVPKAWMLNSEGGMVSDGYAMHSLIKLLAPDISVIGVGMVQSIAVIPFLACSYRVCTSSTDFMIHQGTFQTVQPEPQSDIPGMAKELIRQNKTYAKIIADATGLSLKKVNRMIERGTFFSAEEALEMGFVHEIV